MNLPDLAGGPSYSIIWVCSGKRISLFAMNAAVLNVWDANYSLPIKRQTLSSSCSVAENFLLFINWRYIRNVAISCHWTCPNPVIFIAHLKLPLMLFMYLSLWLPTKWLQAIKHYATANKNEKNTLCLSWNTFKHSMLFTGKICLTQGSICSCFYKTESLPLK
jgi:hypothetical protein